MDFITSNIDDLNKKLSFTLEIDKMTQIMRRTLLTDSSRYENDAEHSWHIAVMALIFKDYAKETPDIYKSAALCVVHDLVEIYAGDTYAYDKIGNQNKKEREEAAAEKLFAQLPQQEASKLRTLWEEFDKLESAESKYANCLDRLQPFLHNIKTNGKSWEKNSTKAQDVRNHQKIIREFMPKLSDFLEENIQLAIKNKWLKDE